MNHSLYRSSYDQRQLKFEASGSSDQAWDYGGLTRAVFTKAGEYISSVMKRDDTDRLYFPRTRIPKGFGDKLAHVYKLAMLQGAVLGAPLSHGLIYFIQNGIISLKDMPLHILMYLYNLDNSEGFLQALGYIGDEGFPYMADAEGMVTGYLQGKEELILSDRFEWLKRYLYKQMLDFFHPDADYLQMAKWTWKPELQVRIKACSIVEMSEILGYPVTLDAMKLFIGNATYEGTRANVAAAKKYLLQYVSEVSLEQMSKLAIFATGSADLHAKLTVHVSTAAGVLPASHTCSNTLDLSTYESYAKFKKLMDLSVSAYEDFSVI